MKYNIIRKHSEDSAPAIVGQAGSKKEARQIISREIAFLSKINTANVVKKLGDVTNIHFAMSNGQTWSVGYWFEKAGA